MTAAGARDRLPARDPSLRVFSQTFLPGFADCTPSGRVRLDALARWLQDIAYADVLDAGLDEVAFWVVRRTRLCVRRFPRFGERLELTTFCSAVGRMWAQRRTDIGAIGASRPDIEAASLWVHLDREARRPWPLTDAELRTYMGAPPHRRISARLRHPAPPAQSDGGVAWRFRSTETDLADHVNNAAYWSPLEEELLAGDEPISIDAEIEYHAPAQPGDKRVLADGARRWIVGQGGELHASILLAPLDDDG
ncbi:MAG: acyl-[acyl-carrier-protein] thioesterase [Solirubrobacteraceae bacterium]